MAVNWEKFLTDCHFTDEQLHDLLTFEHDLPEEVRDVLRRMQAQRKEEQDARQAERQRQVGFLREGVRRYDSDSWVRWMVFPAMPDEDALQRCDWPVDSVQGAVSPTGRTFADAPYVQRRSRSRVLVEQYGGRDV